MTLKKRIFIYNMITIMIPVILVLTIWVVYTGKYSRNQDGQGGQLSRAQNILYSFETELSDMDWDQVEVTDNPEYLPSVQSQKIMELEEMGYHFEIVSEDIPDGGVSHAGHSVLFTNMTSEDTKFMKEKNNSISGCLAKESQILIWDHFQGKKAQYQITAVYDRTRANAEIEGSVVPVYMISPSLIISFLFIVVIGMVLTNVFLNQWLNYYILKPLTELEEGARRIAEGNFEEPVGYEGEDEFGTVCREFNHMREKLQSSEKMRQKYETSRRDLLVGISHDLRSPLTSIKGYAQGLVDGMANTKEKQQRYYNAILTRTNDLERITDSLASLMRFERAGSMFNFVQVNFHEFLKNFLQEEEAYMIQSKAVIDYENQAEDASVRLDTVEMHRVFFNLLENAVKHRKNESTHIRLSVRRMHFEIEKMLEIRFADDGTGVQEDQLDCIFESFYRGDRSRTKPGSFSGLGLSVVKRIVEEHHGKVRACNEGGLCIIITLPEV